MHAERTSRGKGAYATTTTTIGWRCQRELKKLSNIGLHARASRFLVNIHFFTVTARLTWKCLISYFQCGGRENNIRLFSFPEFRNSLLEWITSAKIANIWQIERVRITAIKFEAVGLLFLKWPFRTGSPLLLLRIWARTRAETLVTQANAKPSRLYPLLGRFLPQPDQPLNRLTWWRATAKHFEFTGASLRKMSMFFSFPLS